MPKDKAGMLVLSRDPSETIVIPELGITIMLVEIRHGKRARIGIDANRKLHIFRSEIWERIQQDEPEFADRLKKRGETFIGNMPERAE